MLVLAQPSDIQGHWSEKQVGEWVDKGLAKGYENGLFKPDAKISRAEFITLVNRALGLKTATPINSNAWYTGEIEAARAAGYISGYEDGAIKPDDAISRAEVATIVFSALNMKYSDGKAIPGYKDAGSIPQWARAAFNSLVGEKYLQGYPDNSLRPLSDITRAEAVSVLSRAFGTIYNVAGTYGPDKGTSTINGNVTVNVPGVNIQNTSIEGNLLLTAGVGDGRIQLDNVAVSGITTINGGGAHSIVIDNSNLNEIVVDKESGEKPEIVAQGSSVVGSVYLESWASLEETDLTGEGFDIVQIAPTFKSNAWLDFTGDFEVDVDSPANINLLKGKFSVNISGQAAGSNINILSNATLNKLVADGSVQVKGTGAVKRAEIDTDGVIIQQQVADIILTQGTIASIGGQTVESSAQSGADINGAGSSSPQTFTGYITTEDDFAANLGEDTAYMIYMKLMAESGLGITFQQNGKWVFYYFDGTIASGNASPWTFNGTGAQLTAWNIVANQVNDGGSNSPVPVIVAGALNGNTLTNPGPDKDGILYQVITVTSINGGSGQGGGGSASLLIPPALNAVSTAVYQAVYLTFTDDAAWRAAVTAVEDGSTALGQTQYAVAAGAITINDGVLNAGTHTITVTATGYEDAEATQTILQSSTGGSGQGGGGSASLQTFTGYITTEDDFAANLGEDTAYMIYMKPMAESGLGITFQQNGTWVFYYFDGTIASGSTKPWAFNGTGSQLAAWNIVGNQVDNGKARYPVPVIVTGSLNGDTETNPGLDADGINYPVIAVETINLTS
jgi:hypothetical protein